MAVARDPIEKGLVGPAGEHFVLFRLYRQGMLASLAPPGLSTVDVLVLSYDEDIIATVQVKTRTRGRDRGWHMSKKHERIDAARHFYAFVDLEDDPPTTYIVPSAKVAKVLRDSHKAWEDAKPSRSRESKMRRIQPSYPDSGPGFESGWLNEYREKWDLLRAVV
jgi:hypothetical protein